MSDEQAVSIEQIAPGQAQEAGPGQAVAEAVQQAIAQEPAAANEGGGPTVEVESSAENEKRMHPQWAPEVLRLAYFGPFLYPTGYGEAARSHAKAMKGAGVGVMARLNQQPPASLTPELIRSDHQVNEMLDDRFWPKDPREREPQVWLWHVTPDAWARVQPKKLHVGYAVWECEGLPEGWAQACNEHMDALLTSSEFSADLFRRGGVTIPVRVCPHPIDTERFNLQTDASGLRANFGDVQTVFLVVSQWMPRKGVEDTLMAFATEFKADEPVALVMLTWRWSHAVRERNACKGYASFVLRGLNIPAVPPVFFIGDNIPPLTLPVLYAASDVLVLPSRGEAFALPVFEAAACGRPSIVTGWGGMWDHITDDCAYRVAYDMETVHGMGPRWKHYNSTQKWARPKFDDLRRAMREAHENQGETKMKGIRARKVAESLSPALMGPQMAGVLRELLDTVQPKS